MTCTGGEEVIGWDVYGFWYCPACSPTNQEQNSEGTNEPIVIAIWNDDPQYPADARCRLCGGYLRTQHKEK